MRRTALAIFALAGLALVVYVTTPPRLVNSAELPPLPADLDAYLADREQRVHAERGIIPGTAKRITWREPGQRTEYAVLYFHGFSSSRQGLAPVPARVAEALDANLFETRLTGHALEREPLADILAEDWLEDAAEALAIGQRLGERLVVIGTSTGATLALAMAEHPAFDAVDTLVLVSPNFGPANEQAGLVTGPGGHLIARVVGGKTRSWEPHNELQARYWTTTYPITAAVEMMRLVDFTQAQLPLGLDSNLLAFLSPADTVISPAVARSALDRITAKRSRLVEMPGSGDPANHILAGDILSPETTPGVAAAIVDFVREH